jgi:hypothetical protein
VKACAEALGGQPELGEGPGWGIPGPLTLAVPTVDLSTPAAQSLAGRAGQLSVPSPMDKCEALSAPGACHYH